MTDRRRRWSFGLRTLFLVVTVLAIPLGWVAYQLNWIRERHAFIYNNEMQDVIPLFIQMFGEPSDAPGMPWSLRLFGEDAVAEITICETPDPMQIDRAKRLFPEARFYWRDWIISLDNLKPAYIPNERSDGTLRWPDKERYP